MSLIEYLRKDVDEDISKLVSFYTTLVLPIPNDSIVRMIDNLDVSHEVLIVDLISYFLGKDNPFITTVMEIPQVNLVEGPSLDSQVEGLVHTLTTWANDEFFNETRNIIQDIGLELENSGFDMTPTEGKQLKNILIVEFLITRRDIVDHENDGRSDGTIIGVD